MWGRSELRARWRSWVILGLLAGVTFGLAAVTVRTAGAAVKLRVTGGAAEYVELPACEAMTLTFPAPVMVRVEPLIVAGPVTE